MSVTSTPGQKDPTRARLSAWLGDRALMAGPTEGKVRRTTLWFGVVCGMSFSLALWGVEAVSLAMAHVAYAWITPLAGMLLSILTCTLAAVLTYLSNRTLLGLLFWLLAAVVAAELTVALPLRITPWLMKLIEPGLVARLPIYPYNDTVRAWTAGSSLWLAIFFCIFGLLQLTLVEQAALAAAPASRLVPYFVCVPIMLLASVITSNIVNEQLHTPLVMVNQVIQFGVDNRGKTVDVLLARQERLGAIADLSDLIGRPRRLFMGSFNGGYGQAEVLVDFSGTWADCSTVNAQPVYCQILGNP